jgi:uncharacterized protein
MPANTYAIPVNDRWLAFAPLLNVAAVVNTPAVTLLRADPPAPEDSPLANLAANLAADATPPPVPEGPARPPFLGLILTRGCNMACRYCDFAAGESGAAMSPELISQALAGWAEWVARTGGRELDLHFFGGEPFTQPDLIEIAVHRTRYLAQNYGLSSRVEATTNGLLSARMLTFVRDHFDSLVLSLDGQAEDHDRHRPLRDASGSFRQVWATAQALADSPVKLCLRCCVSQANVVRLPEIAAWLCASLQPETLTFESLKPTPEAAAAGLLAPDPGQFAAEFIAARRLAEQHGTTCVYSALYDRPRRTFCPVGQDTFIVAPDRSVRSCYLRRRAWGTRGLDLQIGRVEADGRLVLDEEAVHRLRVLTADRPRCTRCFCRWSCAGGCLVTETPPGHSLEYTPFCWQTRLLQAGVLLERLGLPDQVDRLLADGEAVARLCEHPDDRVEGSAA